MPSIYLCKILAQDQELYEDSSLTFNKIYYDQDIKKDQIRYQMKSYSH